MKTQNKNTAANIEKTVIESMYQETKETLTNIRIKIDYHIKNTYIKKINFTGGVKPALKAWMEIS